MAGKPMFISGDEVKTVLTYTDLIPAMENALARFSDRENGLVVQPVRSIVEVNKFNGFLGVMPAFSEHDDAMATKLVTYYPDNKEISTHNACVVVFNPRNGAVLAVMDGEMITAMRTAAVSAAVTKHLCREKPEVLSIIGAGIQAHSHLEALTSLFTFSEVRVYSRTRSKAESLVAKMMGGKVCDSVKEAVSEADVIVTVTSSPSPVLKAEWVKPGTHINAVGACRPCWHEIEAELVRSSILYVDSRDAANVESGDVISSKAEIYAEVGEMFRGVKPAHRDKTTLFKSLGLAVEDAVSAKLVYDKLIKPTS